MVEELSKVKQDPTRLVASICKHQLLILRLRIAKFTNYILRCRFASPPPLNFIKNHVS